MNNIRLYFKLIRMTIKSQLAYKTSFIMMSVGHFAITFIEFIGVYALFLRFDRINGFTIREVAVFYGLVNSAFAVAEAIGRGYDVFPNYVRMGTFDRILLRPRGIGLQILGAECQLMRIGRLGQGLLVLGWGLAGLQVGLGPAGILLLILGFAGGTAFFLGLFMCQATLSFWSVQSLEVVNVFTYGGVQTAQYPLSIYKKWFQRLFTFVIPMGCISYYPLMGVLRGQNMAAAFLAPMMGFAFLAAARVLFGIGTRYYCSTGS